MRLKSYGDMAFSVAAPKHWNDIPLDIKLSGSVDVLKSRLKTYLFRLAFNWLFVLVLLLVSYFLFLIVKRYRAFVYTAIQIKLLLLLLMLTIHVYLRLTETVVIWYSQIRIIWYHLPAPLVKCMYYHMHGDYQHWSEDKYPHTSDKDIEKHEKWCSKKSIIETLLIANYPQWPPFCFLRRIQYILVCTSYEATVT